MSKDQAKSNRPGPASRLREALQGLLERAREEAQELTDRLSPRPALQPVPVRNNRRRPAPR